MAALQPEWESIELNILWCLCTPLSPLWNFLCAHIVDAIGKVLAIWIRFRASIDEAKCLLIWKFRTVAVSILSHTSQKLWNRRFVYAVRTTELENENEWMNQRPAAAKCTDQHICVKVFSHRNRLCKRRKYIIKIAARSPNTLCICVYLSATTQWRQSRSLCARTVHDADDAATALQLSWTNIWLVFSFSSRVWFVAKFPVLPSVFSQAKFDGFFIRFDLFRLLGELLSSACHVIYDNRRN